MLSPIHLMLNPIHLMLSPIHLMLSPIHLMLSSIYLMLSSTHLILRLTIVMCAVVCLGFNCAAMTNDASNSIHPDSLQSVVTLRYNLAPGDHFAYKLITDQIVVNDHSMRLQTTFNLRALDRDERGNTRCRINLSSDPVRDSSAMHTGDKRHKRFAGYRSWVQEQAYEAVLDALGRILASTVIVYNDENASNVSEAQAEPLSARATQYTNTPEETPATPELMNFILPTSSVTSSISEGAVWIDTLTIKSKTQFVTSIRQGQTSPPVITKDTLVRTTRVDSVRMQNGRQQCYLSLTTKRHNAGGSRFVAFSTIQRDVSSGLVVVLQEKAYRLENDNPTLHYTASATLVREQSTTLPPTE